jgi:hypothetical protein
MSRAKMQRKQEVLKHPDLYNLVQAQGGSWSRASLYQPKDRHFKIREKPRIIDNSDQTGSKGKEMGAAQ